MDTGTFTSDKVELDQLLHQVKKGVIQLPEFQRGWIWDESHICDLLASLSLSFPIGSLMLLRTGNPDVRFKPRPVAGVKLDEGVDPEYYILDGQQRMTSLFQSLMLDEPVQTRDHRGRDVHRWFYIDINTALDPYADREDAVLSIPEDRMVRRSRHEVIHDYSSPDAELEHSIFPLNEVFDSYEWRSRYKDFWDDSERSRRWDEFERQVITRFQRYLVPVIQLLNSTPKEAVCKVFEKVNTGGVTLTVFELVTATFAADEHDLRADWEGPRDKRGKQCGEGRRDRLQAHPVLEGVSATDFLQSVTLMATYDRKRNAPDAPISCKRADVLKLDLGDYLKWADQVELGYFEAARLLHSQQVFTDKDLPYGTQLVPLAAMLALLGSEGKKQPIRKLLARWYWCGVLGELYGSAVETRSARDFEQVPTWLNGGAAPNTIVDSNFAAERLLSLRTRNSAAYKGIHALLMRDGGRDFISGEPIEAAVYFDESIDVHHIFPRAYCQRCDLPRDLFDSIVNKTPLSSRTNRIIGSKAPSEYLSLLEREHGLSPCKLDDILRSHLIDPDPLRRDDFWGFFAARKEALLSRIEDVTQKRVAREDQVEDLLGQLRD